MEEEQILEIIDIEEFLLHVRLVSYCNMELSIDKDKRNKKIEYLDELIEDSLEIEDSEMLNELYPFERIYEDTEEYIETNPITEKMTISLKNYIDVVSNISYNMILELYKELEKMGKVELSWDKNKNDFVYVPKND